MVLHCSAKFFFTGKIGYITEKYDYLLFPVAQNLQNIIQEQIQNLSSGTSMLPAMAASTVPTASTVSSTSTSMVPTSTGGPRAPPQAQPSYSVVPGSITAPTATPTVTSAAASAASTLNSNAQAALMILLTAQMQSQSGEPSLLQNPQVVSVLQNLVNNAGGGSSAEDQKTQPSVDLNDLMKDPSLASVFRPTTAAATNVNGLSAAMTAAAAASRPALLDTPKSRPILLNNPPTAAPPPPPQTSNTQNEATAAAASVTNNLNNLLNTQNLNQLLGSLTGTGGSTATSVDPQPTSANPSTVASGGGVHPQPPAPQQQALLGAVPTSLASNGLYQQQHHQATNPQRPVLYDGTGQSLLGFPYQNPAAVAHAAANAAATSAVTANGHHPQQTAAHAAFYIQQQPSQQQLYQQQAQLFGLQGFTAAAAAAPPPPPTHHHPHSHQPAMTMSNPQAAFLNPNSMTFATPASMAMALTPSSIMNSIQHVPTLTAAASGYHYNQHGAIGTPVVAPGTPVGHGLKRKISIPPSPEQSPEGPYIGQHSQGLGGHYASSYLSKKAKY